ncbi:hypothetical protein [Couchioplanes caeruleus]|uniref:hypothetical protein n=1 Tax=Couchioplanes caeruleus TaxID=56438 RepID=UPI00147299FE|nr:hypothetical protein [Couchioplanes caeruleus]
MALIVHIGRRRLPVAWHRPAPALAARPFVFWPAAVLSGVTLAVGSARLAGNDIGIWVVGARRLGAAVLGLLLAAAITRAARTGDGARTASPR